MWKNVLPKIGIGNKGGSSSKGIGERMIQRVGHIGILVKEIEKTLPKFTEALGLPAPSIKDVPERRMKVAVVSLGNLDLEFIEDYSEDGAFSKMVREHGNMIHHFTLITDQIEEDISLLMGRGVKMMDSVPKVGLRGKKIAFLSPEFLDGISIELSEP
jgi:methylmalonyl-CoA epimerase